MPTRRLDSVVEQVEPDMTLTAPAGAIGG